MANSIYENTDPASAALRKLHLALTATYHDIVSAELSTTNVFDGEVLGNLLRIIYQNIERVTGQEAYDTHACNDDIAAKGVVALTLQGTTPHIRRKVIQDTAQ
ncbi:hypothetical protein [Pseudoalteromonas luteoviolacea]|uniref:hypothetical protein n=1 Tax=Pseudoalteromonas luteoviolacea TaxID=43657 RepID=UPI0012DA5430|nr:hypothetical protein [Pseudoalteromonas luteoviolacea]MBQ4877690.1 hypothetical protein [Pseudoalteromonas luteoviolacea]MBQ4906864.1 hypothetical protein [Pseudoalteromonas luteoviolacea]